MNLTIGVPRALLYYKYRYLWRTFFEALGCPVVLSEPTNPQILEDGARFSIDECCLPAKIYMGHVHSLIGRCDYIFVPRVVNFGRNETVCVKFHALYDIVKNTFPDAKLLDCNINVENGESELSGFVKMGAQLGASRLRATAAYRMASREQARQGRLAARALAEALNAPAAPDVPAPLKILLAAHAYNARDAMLGGAVARQIGRLGGTVLYADAADSRACVQKSGELSQRLYWTYNKELVGAIGLHQDKVDGVVLLTAFPCGPDSLVNELILRKIARVPVVNVVLDELQGEAGLETRLESFLDIIREKKKTAGGAGVAHG